MTRRATVRLAATIALGAGLGLAAPMLPALSATSPPQTCQSAAVGVSSQLVAVQSLVGQLSVPANVQAQLAAANATALGALSKACAQVPTFPTFPPFGP